MREKQFKNGSKCVRALVSKKDYSEFKQKLEETRRFETISQFLRFQIRKFLDDDYVK